jgi:hypothetical protein
MNNNHKQSIGFYTRTRIIIALAASFTALWQLPDPASQENKIAIPIERLIPKQEELNVLAQPNPTALKSVRPISL